MNLGYHSWSSWIFDKVNGEKVRNFRQFVDVLHNNIEKYVVLKDKNGFSMVLDHQLAIDSRSEILQTYRVPNYHSKDLFQLPKVTPPKKTTQVQ